jgi:hypothetical protein
MRRLRTGMAAAHDSRWTANHLRGSVALLAAALLVVTSMVASNLHGIRRIEAAAVEYRAELGRLESLAEGTRLAQVEFKTQVQEWKNILLRGHDRAQFERFLGAFLARNAEIQAQLEGLVELARATRLQGLDRTLNTQFNRFAGTVDGFEDASSTAFAERLERQTTAMRVTTWAHAGVLVIVLLTGTFVAGRSIAPAR